MADEQGYLVPRATLDRIQAISDWVRNFRISGPYVSSRNTPAGMSVYVGAPRKPPTPAPAPPTIIAKITGNVSGQVGRYTAKRITPETDTEATGNLSEADLGTLSDTDDLIVWHLPEIAIGASANLLDVDGIYEGTRAGVTSDGKTIVRIGAMPVGKTDSPTTLGGNTEGSESADTTSWERTSGNPVDVWIQTRQGFFHAGDEKWYAYARKFSYDSCGLLIAVSGETRIEIDAPEDC